MKRIFLILFVFHLLFCGTVFSQQKITTIILVRHAEKSTTPADDPILTDQGAARAELLVRMFENSGLNAIYTSQFARTRMTAEPLARKIGLQVQTVDADGTNKLVSSILTKHAGGTVLVVGHSNTLPEIIQALGAGKVREIEDMDYDNMYVVSVAQKGTANVLRLKFFNPNTEQVCQ